MRICRWVKIWVEPRKTIRSIIDTHPTRVILWLAVLAGVASALSWMGYFWTQYPGEETVHHPLFVTGLLVGGAIFGLIHLYLGGWLLKIVGQWLGGTGEFIEVKCALGWSYYPFMVGSIFNIISFFLIPYPLWYLIIASLSALILIWAFILQFKLIGEAHRFSAWRALVSVLIVFVIVFVAIMLLSLLVPLLHPLFVTAAVF